MNDTKRSNKAKVAIIVAIVLIITIAAVAIIVILFVKHSNLPLRNRKNIYDHYAYFVPESAKSDTKYALIDKDGKELTEYNIEKFDQFIDGYTIVKTTEGWGIINDSGEMTVPPNKYDALSRVGGLYTALEPGLPERKLLHGSGHVVTTYSSTLNADLNKENSYGNKRAVAVAIRREDDTYDIYDASGEKIESIKSKTTPVISASSSYLGIRNNITAVSYDNGIILISNSDLKVIYRASEISRNYRLINVSFDGARMTFKETKKDSNYEKINQAFYANGVFKEVGDECGRLDIMNSEPSQTGYIACSLTSHNGFYDSRGNLRYYGNLYSDKQYAIIDASHYATYSRNGTAMIGNHSISAVTNIEAIGQNYIVKSGTRYFIYSDDGVKKCTLPNNYISFGGFNNYGAAILTVRSNIDSNNSTTKQYLIDQSCSKISSKYDALSTLGNNYYVTKTNISNVTTNSTYAYEVGLIDKTGTEKIKTGEFESIYGTGSFEGEYRFIIGRRTDGVSILFDSNLNKIAKFKGSAIFDNIQTMLKVYGEKLIAYYSPNGTELHSIPVSEWSVPHT